MQNLVELSLVGAPKAAGTSSFLTGPLTIVGRLSVRFFGLEVGDAGSIEQLSGVYPLRRPQSNHDPEEDDCYAEYLNK